jgi:hypothetical protein
LRLGTTTGCVRAGAGLATGTVRRGCGAGFSTMTGSSLLSDGCDVLEGFAAAGGLVVAGGLEAGEFDWPCGVSLG